MQEKKREEKEESKKKVEKERGEEGEKMKGNTDILERRRKGAREGEGRQGEREFLKSSLTPRIT